MYRARDTRLKNADSLVIKNEWMSLSIFLLLHDVHCAPLVLSPMASCFFPLSLFISLQNFGICRSIIWQDIGIRYILASYLYSVQIILNSHFPHLLWQIILQPSNLLSTKCQCRIHSSHFLPLCFYLSCPFFHRPYSYTYVVASQSIAEFSHRFSIAFDYKNKDPSAVFHAWCCGENLLRGRRHFVIITMEMLSVIST